MDAIVIVVGTVVCAWLLAEVTEWLFDHRGQWQKGPRYRRWR